MFVSVFTYLLYVCYVSSKTCVEPIENKSQSLRLGFIELSVLLLLLVCGIIMSSSTHHRKVIPTNKILNIFYDWLCQNFGNSKF